MRVVLLYLQTLYSQLGDCGCFSVRCMLHLMTVVYYLVGHILYILRTNTSEIVTWWKEVTCFIAVVFTTALWKN